MMSNGEMNRIETAYQLMNSGLSDQELIQRTGMSAGQISASYAQVQRERSQKNK